MNSYQEGTDTVCCWYDCPSLTVFQRKLKTCLFQHKTVARSPRIAKGLISRLSFVVFMYIDITCTGHTIIIFGMYFF